MNSPYIFTDFPCPKLYHSDGNVTDKSSNAKLSMVQFLEEQKILGYAKEYIDHNHAIIAIKQLGKIFVLRRIKNYIPCIPVLSVVTVSSIFKLVRFQLHALS